MKSRFTILFPVLFFAVIIVIAIAPQKMAAQATPDKKEAPKPAKSASEYLLENWNYVGNKLIAMAEEA